MTTAQSPHALLKAQADKIASALKAAERGESTVTSDPYGKITRARTQKNSIRFAVVMDDKVIRIKMTWAAIRKMDEAGISEFIVKQMLEAREQ